MACTDTILVSLCSRPAVCLYVTVDRSQTWLTRIQLSGFTPQQAAAMTTLLVSASISAACQVIEGQITDSFVLNWLDLLCFLLSGLPANGTIAAEVAFMFNEWYRPNSSLEFPRGGSQAMVNALVK